VPRKEHDEELRAICGQAGKSPCEAITAARRIEE